MISLARGKVIVFILGSGGLWSSDLNKMSVTKEKSHCKSLLLSTKQGQYIFEVGAEYL